MNDEYQVAWGVWCVVWGGVTGHREAWAKHNGKRVEFATRSEAEAEAKRLRASITGHGLASFSYNAREIFD